MLPIIPTKSSGRLLFCLVLLPNQQRLQIAGRMNWLKKDLSLRECELMVSNIQIMLASSPSWFRPITICLYILGLVSALFSLVFGMRFVNSPESAQRPLYVSFVLLVGIDFLIFATTSATGPLLRSIYLWPTLIWFFIHLVLLVAVVSYNSESKREVN